MDQKIKIVFLLLVLVQALHSIEEYYGRLWEVFAPARFIIALVSKDHEAGFVAINIGLFVAGMLCWFFAVRNYSFAAGPIWFLTVMEIINSIGHSVWAIMERDYVPGVATAPVLFILAIYLVSKLIRTNRTTGHRSG